MAVAAGNVKDEPLGDILGGARWGQIVTTISGTALIITADKTDDGGALGRSQGDRAGFHAGVDGDEPTVHQSGPRRLWDIVDDLRYRWLWEAHCPSTEPSSPSPQTALAI